jgi:ribonuclease HI
MKYIIYTDGGSRGNPGHAASAFVIINSQNKKLEEKGSYIGLATNNEAEYQAVEKALSFFVNSYKDAKEAKVEIRADSQLIVSQLADKWKIKNDNLRSYYNQIKEHEKKIGQVEYKYIPRVQNKDADLIVNITLDTQLQIL